MTPNDTQPTYSHFPLVGGLSLASLCVIALVSTSCRKATKTTPHTLRTAHAKPSKPTPRRAKRVTKPTLVVRALPGSREPSGAVALPEHKGILVVDDEPKEAPADGIFFYRAKQTTLTMVPVTLPDDTPKWNDWEGATANRSHIYLLASHAKNKSSRCRICRFSRTSFRVSAKRATIGGPITCAGGKSQRARIIQLLKQAAKQHSFALPSEMEDRKAKQGGLDIEGIAWHQQTRSLLLGLRGPLATKQRKSYAITLRAQWKPNDKLAIQFHGLLDLGGKGVRDLSTIAPNRILIGAGPSGTGTTFALHMLPHTSVVAKGLIKPTKKIKLALPLLPDKRVFRLEALALLKGTLFLLSDDGSWDDETAHYTAWVTPRLVP